VALVFISYCAADRQVADRLCATIEAAGVSCWIAPRDIRPGADWAEQIIDGITAAEVLVLLYSAAANSSQQVRREVERAVHHGLTLAPLRIEDTPMSKSLAYFLSAQHWYDAFDGNLDGHLTCFAQRLLVSSASPAARANPVTIPAKPIQGITWPPDLLASMERRLALFVGPIAGLLVQRAARQAVDASDLARLVAVEIDDPEARREFIAGEPD
jgi:hypothetical protein